MPTVPFIALGVSLVLVVMFHMFLGVGIAVTVSRQLPAPTMGAWLLRLAGHGFTSNTKGRTRFPAGGLYNFADDTVTQPDLLVCI